MGAGLRAGTAGGPRRLSASTWLLLLALLTAATPQALAQAPAPEQLAEARRAPVPMAMAPLSVDPPFRPLAGLLGTLLSSRLIESGRFAEVVSDRLEQQVDECRRRADGAGTVESCWIRIGMGLAAQVLVSGEVRGGRDACTVTVRLTELERRVTARLFVEHLAPCGDEQLHGQLAAAATLLAGWHAARPDDDEEEAAGADGGLRLAAEPPDVPFALNGPQGYLAQGRLPVQLDGLRQGRYALRITAPGFPERRTMLKVPAGGQESVLVRLDQAPATAAEAGAASAAEPQTTPRRPSRPRPEHCRAGELRPDGVHCCWPGQRWDASAGRCHGAVQCPAGEPYPADGARRGCLPASADHFAGLALRLAAAPLSVGPELTLALRDRGLLRYAWVRGSLLPGWREGGATFGFEAALFPLALRWRPGGGHELGLRAAPLAYGRRSMEDPGGNQAVTYLGTVGVYHALRRPGWLVEVALEAAAGWHRVRYSADWQRVVEEADFLGLPPLSLTVGVALD